MTSRRSRPFTMKITSSPHTLSESSMKSTDRLSLTAQMMPGSQRGLPAVSARMRYLTGVRQHPVMCDTARVCDGRLQAVLARDAASTPSRH